MFLKSLILTREDGKVIRNITFHDGLNLIIDETPFVSGKETGNNVGKTTVLKLIDFCLGADAKGIYSDTEHKKNEYKLVKDFLVNNKVKVLLVLKEDLANEKSSEVHIERNFLARNNKIQRINGKDKKDDEFEEALTDILYPGHYGKKPSFRQIISHNIRYKDLSMNNTLKNLDTFTKDVEYETLYLFLFGCDFEKGDDKLEIRAQIDIEDKFKKRLESNQTKFAYETALAVITMEINELEQRKASLDINPDFESDLDKLNEIKYEINCVASEINRLELRKKIIIETHEEMQSDKSNIDLQQLQQIYQQATSLVDGIQKTFQELCAFHNQMIDAKIKFIDQDLPKLDNDLVKKRSHLNKLLAEESELSYAVTKSDSFGLLEQIISDLNEKYQKKGEYENTLGQLNTVSAKIIELNDRLIKIDEGLFSGVFENKVKEQIIKFNKHFSSVSYELYGEKYALEPVIKTNKKGQRLYEFTAFNLNFSSGKKQGEISCFDIAYTLFADEEEIPCMHFLLNDKKELMHANQLLMIGKLVNAKGIQFIASILKDKLPEELKKDEYVILKLSQEDKLFKIESAQGNLI